MTMKKLYVMSGVTGVTGNELMRHLPRNRSRYLFV